MSLIEGKIIAITGASSGIGEATARLLAAKGAKVFLGARRDDRLAAIAGEIGEAAGYRRLDVTDRADVEQFIAGAVEKFGRIDVLVNNAGLMPNSPLAALKIDDWDRMIDVNIKGVLYGIAAALPRMLTQNSGHIINLSSVAGHVVFQNSAVYCGTKFAVRAISEGLRMESGPTIRTTLISPGAVATELTDTITDETTKKGVSELYQFAINADDIARAVAYAIEQPDNVDINEILLRPTAQRG